MKHKKIISFEEIKREREFSRELEKCGIKKFFIFTNGCFDLFHAGHASLLNTMKSACSLNSKLVVGINSDASVKALKGEGRPILSAKQRAYTVACHEAVDYVFIFNTKTVAKQLKELQPDFWCKGGDYDEESLNKSELKASGNAILKVIPFVENISSTDIINKITTY
jgi:D-beta-D-heptose 7-phosphate kinase/D-beta-D-heptose 1-phosphate adenosyltransferase|tara:strand:+ start:1635 stop:2135 length:501 start_codon:yes stop_codon:yes gene_type:complete